MICLGGAPSTVYEYHDQLWLFHGGGPSKKDRIPTVLGVAQFCNYSGEGICLISQGLGISNRTKETWKFRTCSESVFRVFPDLFRISLRICSTVLGAPPTLIAHPLVRMSLEQKDVETCLGSRGGGGLLTSCGEWGFVSWQGV